MNKKALVITCAILALSFTVISFACATEEQSAGAKAKNFWQKLFGYPANVAKESATVVADAGKSSVSAVANEVKTVGVVTSGDVAKTPDLITEPLKAVGDTTYQAVTGTANVPVEAANQTADAAQAN